jgi:signal transduction histidine kinase
MKAEHRGIDLGAKAPRPMIVQGESHELGVLLTNLVENALRYTPAGGVVDVEACASGGHPELRVVDNGPGIAPPERELVFDRFYRGKDAQRLAHEPHGSGLGLAIVRAIAERHGAAVSLHTPPGGCGLEVRVAFPATLPPLDRSDTRAPATDAVAASVRDTS